MLPQAHLVDVERYYDFIYHWAQITNRFRAFRKVGSYAIHRGLADPRTGEFSPDTIHRLVQGSVAVPGPIDALDVGCGYGGSCIELHKMLAGRWHGITISRRQARIAMQNAIALGLGSALTFARASFDAPLPRPFNLMCGIESLIHSPAPSGTISNLVRSLVPGGQFIIVDDMPVDDVPANFARDLERFKGLWRCPVMPTAGRWRAHLVSEGCDIEEVHDLTDLMRPRSEADVVAGLAEVQMKRRWRDHCGLRMVADAQAGGLLLERLASARIVRYVMIVARKKTI